MRKLAKIVKIDKLEKHPNADTLDVCHVGGWKVVAKSNTHSEGELVVYCEIDSWLPHSIAPFLTKEGKTPRIFNQIEGQVLKSVRLRGIVSQGLLLPLNILNSDYIPVIEDDVSEMLNITKYEPPVSASLAGDLRCAFPGYVPKTDSERIQNLTSELQVWAQNKELFSITEKLDGTSVSFIRNEEDIHVCSRNWSIRPSEQNTYWKMYYKYNIESILQNNSFNIAIQGEVVGSGIQSNEYKLNEARLFVFNVYNIDEKRYLNMPEMETFCQENKLDTVPKIDTKILDESTTIDELLLQATDASLLNKNTLREGLVFKGINNTQLNFKVISNEWLLKH